MWTLTGTVTNLTGRGLKFTLLTYNKEHSKRGKKKSPMIIAGELQKKKEKKRKSSILVLESLQNHHQEPFPHQQII